MRKRLLKLLNSVRSWLADAWNKRKGRNSTKSTAPMSKYPSHLLQDITDLNTKIITETQGALVQFCTRTRYAVSVQDQAARKRIQADLDHGVGLFCAAHVMAIFEKALPSEHWDDIFEPDDVILLKALRHIRRCAANGFTGDRVQDDAVEFDAVMASGRPLRGVESFDAAQIRLSEMIGFDAFPILQGLANKALIEVHQAK